MFFKKTQLFSMKGSDSDRLSLCWIRPNTKFQWSSNPNSDIRSYTMQYVKWVIEVTPCMNFPWSDVSSMATRRFKPDRLYIT